MGIDLAWEWEMVEAAMDVEEYMLDRKKGWGIRQRYGIPSIWGNMNG